MAETVRRLIWFTIVAVALSFVLFAVLGNVLSENAADSGPVPVRDVVSSGEHRLTGIVMLPLSCDELTVEPEEVAPATYDLVFETWEDPSVVCSQTPTPRPFQAIVFASSSGTTFTASLDGTEFPIVVLPDTSTSTSS